MEERIVTVACADSEVPKVVRSEVFVTVTEVYCLVGCDVIERCQHLGGRHCVHSQGVTILPQDSHSRQRQTACECNIKTRNFVMCYVTHIVHASSSRTTNTAASPTVSNL